ncbi:uncharacterized protein LOC128835494 [Malaclemys terrapin pileata]|uniref:uncharacterized protein LOC128835494 n=1 Tax=Malaclemys terrapin pileata TaxID=2991368 RepID=UPI0023A7942B|nr:uncharacterized protein LOC128835494 [Malaclemys terrapin pileata]
MAVGIALLLGLGSAAGAFPVSTDPSPVMGLLGSDMLLKCSFPADLRGGARDEMLLVRWYFQGRRVAELDGIPITTRVGAILFSQQQGHAQASLLLPGVTLADQGHYRCSEREHRGLPRSYSHCPGCWGRVSGRAGGPGAAPAPEPRPGPAPAAAGAGGRQGAGRVRLGRWLAGRAGRSLPWKPPPPRLLDSPSLSPPALPRVEVPSPVVQRDEDSALVCCVRGFYPQDIAVSWLRDGQELNASVFAARRGHRDGTFSLVTVYRFTPTERDLGTLFSCRAQHPLLNQSRQADFRIAFRAGGLEMGLRVLLWVLRASLLLAMAMGGWLYCDTSSQPRKMVEQVMEQATERIWDPLRQRFQQAREVISLWSR